MPWAISLASYDTLYSLWSAQKTHYVTYDVLLSYGGFIFCGFPCNPQQRFVAASFCAVMALFCVVLYVRLGACVCLNNSVRHSIESVFDIAVSHMDIVWGRTRSILYGQEARRNGVLYRRLAILLAISDTVAARLR